MSKLRNRLCVTPLYLGIIGVLLLFFFVILAWLAESFGEMFTDMGMGPEDLPTATGVFVGIPAGIYYLLGVASAGACGWWAYRWRHKVLSRWQHSVLVLVVLSGFALAAALTAIVLFLPISGVILESIEP